MTDLTFHESIVPKVVRQAAAIIAGVHNLPRWKNKDAETKRLVSLCEGHEAEFAHLADCEDGEEILKTARKVRAMIEAAEADGDDGEAPPAPEEAPEVEAPPAPEEAPEVEAPPAPEEAPEAETVDPCPDCGSTAPRVVAGPNEDGNIPEGATYCPDCGFIFANPDGTIPELPDAPEEAPEGDAPERAGHVVKEGSKFVAYTGDLYWTEGKQPLTNPGTKKAATAAVAAYIETGEIPDLSPPAPEAEKPKPAAKPKGERKPKVSYDGKMIKATHTEKDAERIAKMKVTSERSKVLAKLKSSGGRAKFETLVKAGGTPAALGYLIKLGWVVVEG